LVITCVPDVWRYVGAVQTFSRWRATVPFAQVCTIDVRSGTPFVCVEPNACPIFSTAVVMPVFALGFVMKNERRPDVFTVPLNT
jgi:hypothetical protein